MLNPLMTVSLDNVHFFAHHGILEQETRVGNEFIVTLTVSFPVDSYCEDNLDASVSYADLYAIVAEEMNVRADTLEFLSHRIWRRVKEAYPIVERCRVKITKCSPPITSICGSASVEMDG